MNDIFQDMSDIFMVVYLDDILVYSESEALHRNHVRRVLTHLCENNLHIKPEKSLFHTTSIEFLGFMVSPMGIMMDPAKTEAISRWLAPSNVKQVQSFIRFAKFYRRFIVKLLGNRYSSYSSHPKGHQVFGDQRTSKHSTHSSLPSLRHRS